MGLVKPTLESILEQYGIIQATSVSYPLGSSKEVTLWAETKYIIVRVLGTSNSGYQFFNDAIYPVNQSLDITILGGIKGILTVSTNKKFTFNSASGTTATIQMIELAKKEDVPW